MNPTVKFQDAKTFELWLPTKVAEAIGKDGARPHLAITEDKYEIVYYVNGYEVERIVKETK